MHKPSILYIQKYTEWTVTFVYKDNVFFCIKQIIVYFFCHQFVFLTYHLTLKIPHLIKKMWDYSLQPSFIEKVITFSDPVDYSPTL